MGKNKAPFYFPVFYNGLIDGRTLKNQRDCINILFHGRTKDIPSQDEINSVAASKYIHGDELVSRDLRETVRALSFEEVSERIAMLFLHDAKTTAAAFHEWLRSNADISREELQKLEQAARASGEAKDYIAEAFLASLRYTGKAKRIDGGLKTALRNLPKTADTEALFPKSELMVPIPPDDLLENRVRMLVTAFLSSSENEVLQLQNFKDRQLIDAISELRKSGKLSLIDIYKFNNFLEIAAKADELLGAEATEDYEPSEFDFDWFLRFFDAVNNVTDEQMRDLWAKILEGETLHRGKYSFRTLETLRNMDGAELRVFVGVLSDIATDFDGTLVISPSNVESQIYPSGSSNLEDGRVQIDQHKDHKEAYIRTLRGCGLVLPKEQKIVRITGGGKAARIFDAEDIALCINNEGIEDADIEYTVNPLSKVAIELLPIAKSYAHMIKAPRYQNRCLGHAIFMKQHLPDTCNISFHKVLGRGEHEAVIIDYAHKLTKSYFQDLYSRNRWPVW